MIRRVHSELSMNFARSYQHRPAVFRLRQKKEKLFTNCQNPFKFPQKARNYASGNASTHTRHHSVGDTGIKLLSGRMSFEDYKNMLSISSSKRLTEMHAGDPRVNKSGPNLRISVSQLELQWETKENVGAGEIAGKILKIITVVSSGI